MSDQLAPFTPGSFRTLSQYPTLGQLISAQGSPADWAPTSGLTINPSTGRVTVAQDLLVSGDIYTVDWTDYTSACTFSGIDDWTGGWSGVFYKKLGDIVFIKFYISGHMNAGSAVLRISLPYALHSTMGEFVTVIVQSAGTWQIGVARLSYGYATTRIDFGVGAGTNVDNFGAAAGAQKGAFGNLWYRA